MKMARSSLRVGTVLVVLILNVCSVASIQIEIRIGSRPSTLATIQAEAVAAHLRAHHPSLTTTLVPIEASGDVNSKTLVQGVPLALSNVDFTKALDQAILEGKIDVAVHSLKDIPPDHRWQSGLSIHCPLLREDPADVLIGPYTSLDDLPSGAKVGTSSIRRQAQLRHECLGKDIQVVNLRGNVDARLQALQRGDVDALILARSGIHRMRLDDVGMDGIFCTNIPDLLPGTCQGIVAAVVLEDGDYDSDDFWKANQDATLMTYAERAFLNTLDSSSPWKGRPPLAGLLDKTAKEPSRWLFRGLLARPDGERVLLAEQSAILDGSTLEMKRMAAALGEGVGKELLQHAGQNFFDSSVEERAS